MIAQPEIVTPTRRSPAVVLRAEIAAIEEKLTRLGAALAMRREKLNRLRALEAMTTTAAGRRDER